MRKNRINRITDWIGLYVFVLNPVQSLTEP